jgi:acetyl-CoA carboxylase biotin carboxyl carrier protein
MTFNIDDVMEVLKIVRECKDTELHIDTGEMKLSIAKGKVSSGGSSFMNPVAAVAAPASVAVTPAAEPQQVQQVEAVATPAPTPTPEATPQAVVESEPVSEEGLIPVKSDVTSMFYRSPSPEEPVFIELGDKVEEDTVVCLLEVMKCFRQVMAETRGTIEKICVESNNLVEEGTVLFLIRPE